MRADAVARRRLVAFWDRVPVWDVLRAVLVGLWVVWAFATWWTAPRAATFDETVDAIRSGEVAAYRWGDSWDRPGPIWAAPASLRATGDPAPASYFAWRADNGRVHYLDVDQPGDWREITLPPDRTTPGTDPVRAAVEVAVEDAGLRPGDLRSGLSSAVGVVLFVLGLLVLLGGPAPVIGTRWYWFFVGGVPFGLGVLAWLAMERPWAAPAERAKRRRGLEGFVVALLAGLAASFALTMLESAFDGRFIPWPPG